MAENSAISWTHHTFNAIWGCVEVSPACDRCYARELAKVYGYGWGKDAPRRILSDDYWKQPFRWNRKAEKAKEKARVFTSSMADIFEVHPVVESQLARLWPIVRQTPWLDWLGLTKRAEQIDKKLPLDILQSSNFHMGVTVENQTYTNRIKPGVSWLSVEPLMGPVDLINVKIKDPLTNGFQQLNALTGEIFNSHGHLVGHYCGGGVEWVIVGGGSGSDEQPMELAWALDLMKQCRQYGVAFHFKQTGNVLARKLGIAKKKGDAGKDSSRWPKELQVQEFPKWRDRCPAA